ncbi:unnamed protein product, partial [Effrenium voratum]
LRARGSMPISVKTLFSSMDPGMGGSGKGPKAASPGSSKGVGAGAKGQSVDSTGTKGGPSVGKSTFAGDGKGKGGDTQFTKGDNSGSKGAKKGKDGFSNSGDGGGGDNSGSKGAKKGKDSFSNSGDGGGDDVRFTKGGNSSVDSKGAKGGKDGFRNSGDGGGDDVRFTKGGNSGVDGKGAKGGKDGFSNSDGGAKGGKDGLSTSGNPQFTKGDRSGSKGAKGGKDGFSKSGDWGSNAQFTNKGDRGSKGANQGGKDGCSNSDVGDNVRLTKGADSGVDGKGAKGNVNKSGNGGSDPQITKAADGLRKGDNFGGKGPSDGGNSVHFAKGGDSGGKSGKGVKGGFNKSGDGVSVDVQFTKGDGSKGVAGGFAKGGGKDGDAADVGSTGFPKKARPAPAPETLTIAKKARPQPPAPSGPDDEDSSLQTPPPKRQRQDSSSPAKPQLQSSVSFLTDLEGVPEVPNLTSGGQGTGRTKRIKVLSDSQRAAIARLQCWEDMPAPERKRQREALRRRMQKTQDLKPGLYEKWISATSPATTFDFLKCWLLDPTMATMQVETHFVQQAESKSKSKFIELPLNELEELYKTEEDRKWLMEKVVAKQCGTPHPQDPENGRRRIYKVFKCIERSEGQTKIVGTNLKGSVNVADNKACRQAVVDHLTAQQATFTEPAPAASTAKPKPKVNKVKKALTAEEQRHKDFEKGLKWIDGMASKARATAQRLSESGIAHQEALTSALGDVFARASNLSQQLNKMIFEQKPFDETEMCMHDEWTDMQDWETRVTEAETIIVAKERREAAEKRKLEGKSKAKSKAKKKTEADVKQEPSTPSLATLADWPADQES